MKNNITELIFVIDQSGSMSGLEDDTIGGFNSMLEKQRNEKGVCHISIRCLLHLYLSSLHTDQLSENQFLCSKENLHFV